MSLFEIFRGLFGFPERGGDPFYRGTLLDEDEDDEDEDEDCNGCHGDPFGFDFGPKGQPFGEGFSGIFREMDELFKGIGSWDVPIGQFEFPDIDAHPGPGADKDGAKRRAPRDWMLKQPDSDRPGGFFGEAEGDSHLGARPRDRPAAPYRPPWSRPRNFEDVWETLRKGDGMKQDQDLDTKVTSEGLEGALKPSEPQTKSYFKSISISKIVRPDGTVEERRTERDGRGNEETTVTRALGEQSYTTVTRRDAQGREEQTEQVVNADDRTMVLVNEILSQIVRVDRPMNWGGLATLKPYANFFVDDDVKALKQAMEAKGVNEATIVQILSNRSWDQRQLIIKAFQKQYNVDLEASLKKKLSGDLENVVVSLLKAPADSDAQELKEAMKGFGTNEDTLIEILSTRSNKELQMIAAAYKRDYQKTLEHDVASETTGRFQLLLLALLKAKREENSNIINHELIEEDARELHTWASQKKPNFDAWIPILTERSQHHLNRVFKLYKVYSSQDITDTIKKQMKGDDEKGFLALVQSIQNTPEYLADRLHQSMKNLGTKDGTLIRLIVSHCENDLLSIRVEFRKKYGKSLYTAIREDTRGDYQTALLGLCRGEDL